MKVFVALTLVAVALSVQGKHVGTSFQTMKDYWSNPRGESRIISGKPAADHQFPWQVAVHMNMGNGMSAFCGGSLIHPQWVMTAAHCIDGVESWTLVIGSNHALVGDDNNQVVRKSSYGVHHENYNFYLNNDIGVIKLDEPVELNDNVQTIGIASPDAKLEGISVTVSGWGKTSDASSSISRTLNFVQLDTITNEKCAETYGDAVIISSTLCAVGHPEHSTCNGDSGGPLVVLDGEKATQVGVVSFVHAMGCASGNPSGYVRPGKYLDWLSEKTGASL